MQSATYLTASTLNDNIGDLVALLHFNGTRFRSVHGLGYEIICTPKR